jgi:hypothetical protein
MEQQRFEERSGQQITLQGVPVEFPEQLGKERLKERWSSERMGSAFQ